MRVIYLLFFAFLSHLLCAAQVQFPDAANIARPPVYFHHPGKEYSLLFSYLQPAGAFNDKYFQGTFPDFKESLTQSLQGDVGGVGARVGVGFDFSGHYYFNKEPVRSIGGIKLTYVSLSSVPFKWQTDGNFIYNHANYSAFRFYSFNIGPVVRIALSDISAIRIYSQLCGVIGWNAGWSNEMDYTTYNSDNTRLYVMREQASLKLRTGSGIKNESAISVNFGRAIAVFGFSWGRITFDNASYNSTTSTDVYILQSEVGGYQYQTTSHVNRNADVSPAVPTNYFFFSAGYLFGR